VDKNKVLEKNGRVSVLAGKKRVDDMLVFLAYRKLKRDLAGLPSQGTKIEKGGKE